MIILLVIDIPRLLFDSENIQLVILKKKRLLIRLFETKFTYQG